MSGAPMFQRRHGEFGPEPATSRLREQAGVARVATPFGYPAWLVTRHADVRQVLADARRFTVVLPTEFSRRVAEEEMSDEDVLKERAGDLFSNDPPEHTRLRRMLAHRRVRALMAALAERARTDPGEGMIATLAREHGHELTTDELAAMGHLVLLAGYETTANMLALGTLALLRHPDQQRAVRDGPDRVDAAVEELLRWLSVVSTATMRITTEPVEIAGRRIEAGEMVLACLPAANRDPRLVPDPEVLDLARGTAGHLAFGHGIHHCLGAPLARAEMRIAYPALLRRFPTLRLADPPAEVRLRGPGFVHGVRSLPVTW